MIEFKRGAYPYIVGNSNKLLKLPGAERKQGYIRIPYADWILKYIKDKSDLVFSDYAEEICFQINKKYKKSQEIKNKKSYKLNYFNDTLYDFQTRNVKFMAELKKTIQASEMGAGKTIMAIATAKEINSKKTLIVSPAYLKTNWKNEIKKFTDSSINLITGKRKERLKSLEEIKNFNIINYAMLRDKQYLNKLKNIEFDFLIYDEAHALKNRKSQQHKGAKKLKCNYITLMTGTPIPNHPEELYGLLSVLYPKQFRSYWRFVETFCEVYDSFYHSGKEILGLKNVKQLKNLLTPIMIRETKEDILSELPEKMYQTIELELDNYSKYKTFEKEFVMEYGDDYVFAFNQLIKNIRLRQYLLSPKLLFDNFKGMSTKTKAIKEIISSTDKRIIIFTSSKLYCNLLSKKLDILRYNGDLTETEKDKNLKLFKKNKNAIVITYQAGSQGLNLQFCDTMIFADKMYSPLFIKQAEDRIHRIGQNNKPLYISLMIKNTIDEKIESILKNKNKNIEKILKKKC